MDMKKAPKKRVVWQDIMPAKPISKPIETKPEKKRFWKKLSKPKLSFKLKINKKYVLLVVFVIVIVSATGYYLMDNKIFVRTDQISDDTEKKAIDNTDIGTGKPDFETIVPTSKNINDLGGWTKVSPPNTDPVYAYIDKIGSVPITVSQQPLPSNFINDTENQIDKLSQGFNAKEKVTIGSLIVHIGTSAKGPQSVIFSTNNLLILIKSNSFINNKDWIDYINSMI